MIRSSSPSVVAYVCFFAYAAFAADAPKSESKLKKKVQPSRISSRVEVQPVAGLSDKEAREVSFAAGRVLKHVAQARAEIREKKTDEAATHVAQGLKLISIIENVLPHSKVKTEIKSGDLLYADEDDVTLRYVTLFDELERRDIFSPVIQAKRESEKKRQPTSAKEGSPKTERVAGVAVSHADIAYTAAKLDLDLARHNLNLAKQELSGGKLDAADAALMALQSDGVLFEYVAVDLPLEEVADNLKLAETEIKEGRANEAGAALRVAMDELKRYEKLVGQNRSAEVKELHQEIEKLTAEIEKGGLTDADRKKHASKIADWWQRATKWLKGNTK